MHQPTLTFSTISAAELLDDWNNQSSNIALVKIRLLKLIHYCSLKLLTNAISSACQLVNSFSEQ